MKGKEMFRKTNFYFLLYFLGLFLYYLLVFDSSLYYHHHQPIFLFYRPYLIGFLLYPGGPAELIAQFFLQFFYFNLLGSLIISALSVSIFILVYKLIKKIGNFKFSLILSFVPVCFLLVLQNNYNFPLVITIKYLSAFIFFLIYIKIPERYKAFYILLSFLNYYILGGWFYLFYVLICVLYELLFFKNAAKYISVALNIAVFFILPYIAARYLFVITLKEAYIYTVPSVFYTWPFNFKLSLYFYLFFFSFPVLQVAIFIYLKYIKSKVLKHNKLKRVYNLSVQSIFIFIAAVLILTFSFEKREKKKFYIDYLAEQRRWNELLNISRGMKGYTAQIIFNVNRALYHTGQLLDNMFYYPQILGADGLFLDNFPRPIAIVTTDLYFDLGHIRAAQVMAYEGYTKFGYNPRMLKKIIMTNIINGEFDIAKKILDILNRSILHKKWVKLYREYLFKDFLIESDSLIQLKRKLMPKSDFFIAIGERSDIDLIKLLEENENNKMAFEYLMAYYLLDYNLDDLQKHIDHFKELGYKKYPRHIEEAILLIEFVDSSKKIKLDYSINQQTIEQFEQFNGILSNFENKIEAAKILRRDFFNTYWYYVLFLYPATKK